MTRRLPISPRNLSVKRERDTNSLSVMLLLLTCGLVLSAGFIYAAKLHFTAVRIGYETEHLRRERARLLEVQRRLMLAREQAASPSSLESAARDIGLQPLKPSQIDVGSRSSASSVASAIVGATAPLSR